MSLIMKEHGDYSGSTILYDTFKLSKEPQSPVVSDLTREIFTIVNYVTLCGLISLFGIGSNIINIIVFVKQGFKDSMNISLFGLAIADLACLITMFWNSICYNPLFQRTAETFEPLDIMYLSGGWPHACFNRVTSFITAFITLERCLCITRPLKVKAIITPRRTKVIIIVIFAVMFIVFSPFYAVNRLEWKTDSSLNRSIFRLAYGENRHTVETVTFFIHSVVMSAISLFVVTICTIVLVIKLNKKTKWRQSNAALATSKQETVNIKDKKVVKMVTFISTIFIIAFVPATAIFFTMAYIKEFSFSGEFKNIFFVTWSIAFLLETINSSVNIVVYFNMSTKFRVTFRETFCKSVSEED